MLGIKVSIVRYISDEPQPGIVELHLDDAYGHRHSFVEKSAIVMNSELLLDAHSAYPQQGVVACEVVRRSHDSAGREIVRVTTERPWGVESVDGVTEFDVPPESLMEF